MTVMGNRWGFALLVGALVGMSRFSDFQSQLGAPPGSISDRLSIFTGNGVFEVSENSYRLTEKGRALFPVVVSALQWAQKWYDADEGPAVVLTHTACGAGFTALLECDQCARPLRGAHIDLMAERVTGGVAPVRPGMAAMTAVERRVRRRGR
jgi:DNA-binding HxlR family transcriptional regulator